VRQVHVIMHGISKSFALRPSLTLSGPDSVHNPKLKGIISKYRQVRIHASVRFISSPCLARPRDLLDVELNPSSLAGWVYRARGRSCFSTTGACCGARASTG
jgi:hypothetical protein